MYNTQREFGSDCKMRISFGIGRKEEKKYNNPPPGIYDALNSLSATKPRSTSAVIKKDNWRRSTFTESPTRNNPDGGAYDTLKPFGTGLKNPMTGKDKSRFVYQKNENPSPNAYDVHTATKHTKPRAVGVTFNDVKWYEVHDD